MLQGDCPATEYMSMNTSDSGNLSCCCWLPSAWLVCTVSVSMSRGRSMLK
jgi:hypothetical protein